MNSYRQFLYTLAALTALVGCPGMESDESGETGPQGEPGEPGPPGPPATDGSHIVLVQAEVQVGEYREVVAVCDEGYVTGGGCIFSGDLDRNAPHLIQYVNTEDEYESVPDGWLCAGTNMGPGSEQKYMGTFAVCSGDGPTVDSWLPEETET